MLSRTAPLDAVFDTYDATIDKTISFRHVGMDTDLHRLHDWMNQPHVIPFWELDGPLKKFEAHLHKALNDSHQSLYIGYLDGFPMSYWESYWVHKDIIGEFYDYKAKDQGVHLLIGPESYLGHGYALPLLRAMIRFQFQEQGTDRIVAEPDIRNKRMIHIFEKCGFEAQKAIDLPEKQGLLMFCERRVFEGMWDNA